MIKHELSCEKRKLSQELKAPGNKTQHDLTREK